jgi:polynucleotide 5'-hydroxyl-kinase GRC3/NOL9
VKHAVDKGKTLLIDGPASVSVLSGKIEVFGAPQEVGVKLVIREGKRIPFEVIEKAEFDVMLSEKASLNEVDGSTIPLSWKKTVDEILNQDKPVTIMVIGGVDSGKTSFCAYLGNRVLKMKRTVALIDADLGQADLGPPSTISSRRLTKAIVDPFELGAENIIFVGATSPSADVSRVVDGIENLKTKTLQQRVDVLIINTDGWIEGEDAVRYKIALVKQVKPDLLIGIQEKNELTFLLGALTETHRINIESPSMLRKRDLEERKLMRELGYKKYLKRAQAESFPLRWVKSDSVTFGMGAPPSREMCRKIEDELQAQLLYCEEMPKFVFIVLHKDQWLDEELTEAFEHKLKRKVKIIQEGYEEGLLVALHDEKESFLGIGIVEGIDYVRRTIRVYTPVRKNVASLFLGRVKLDKTGRELGIIDGFADETS